MYYVLFTRSRLLGSRLIRAVTGEPISHCAMLDTDTWIVTHSTLSGIRKDTLAKFKLVNEIRYIVPVYPSRSPNPSAHYDYGAFLYLGLKLILSKVGIRLPKKNLWQSTGMYICTEFISGQVLEKELQLTPMGLYRLLTSKRN